MRERVIGVSWRIMERVRLWAMRHRFYRLYRCILKITPPAHWNPPGGVER
jgi:hypothetical protein